MIEIARITKIDGKKHIALLDTSAISFMQGLRMKGVQAESILKDYDLILIPEWVLTEINDALGRVSYVQDLIEQGYPIYCMEEEKYSDLTNGEEGNLYQIVLASTRQMARIRSIFVMRTPVPVSYKSNDAILCQLIREGSADIKNLSDYRKNVRKITYSKEQEDHSVILVTELVDNEYFAQLVADETVHIIF